MNIIRFKNIRQLREQILANGLEEHVAVLLDSRKVSPDANCLQRMCDIAGQTGASLTYSNYRERHEDGTVCNHPVIDYQIGSLRDDFDFGPLVLLDVADVLAASDDMDDESENLDGGWYALRLRLSIAENFIRIPEYLYTAQKIDYRKSGEQQHDYVDPRNADYQAQMEEGLSNHLYEIDALTHEKQTIDLSNGDFKCEASIIIPVRNRVKTIGDAVKSAISQQTSFPYNVIVVDNDSTDGTRELLAKFDDPRLVVIHLNADEMLGIGGCWNRAVTDERCGRFAVQLDSDDMYSSPSTLSKIVDKFYEENCGMVIGSYTMTDFNLKPIGPGLIAHREWTDDNGANNALRINGFGAPRAFFTPLIREILFPNVSYGEDYAVALRISREYRIGRIYDCLYNCRRWEGNSDAALTVEQTNANNTYKDFVRSVELEARIHQNYANSLTPMSDLERWMYDEDEEDYDDEEDF